MSYEISSVSGSPRAWRVLLACIVKGVDFDINALSFSEGDLKSERFRALNARARVPVLRDGDFVLSESMAILEYLDRKHPTPPLVGEDPREAAQVWRIAMEGDHDLRDATHRLLAPILFHNAGPEGAEIQAAAHALHSEHERLEALLRDNALLAGPRITLADIVCFPDVRLVWRAIERAPDTMEALGFAPYAPKYPRVSAWVDRIETLPGYARTFPPHWRVAA